MEETVPLVKRLNISKSESESMLKKVQFMVYVGKGNRLNEEHIKKIYDEWAIIANRLVRGSQMIEETVASVANDSELENNKRFKDLMNLYQFLLSILGTYDMFFRSSLPRPRYEYLKENVMVILREIA